MEEFRDKLKIQNQIIALCCVILTLFIGFFSASEAGIIDFIQPAGDSRWQSMWHGFVCGAACGILVLMVFSLIRNIRAMGDEKKLKKLYIQENDERQIKIWTSARALSMQIFLMGGLVAGVVAGYFSVTVCVTIIACVFIHSLLGMACKIFYSRKF